MAPDVVVVFYVKSGCSGGRRCSSLCGRNSYEVILNHKKSEE
jgi:hypothetical protein